MKFSLVVTVKNEAGDAAQLIEDVLAQTHAPDEWLLIDGGSNDGTAEVFENVETCRVIRFPGNIAQGRNHGVEKATGDVIVMTDAQCRLEVTWFESMVAAFEQPSDAQSIDYLGGPTRAQLNGPFDVVQWALLDQLNFRVDRRRPPLFSCRNLAFRRRLWERCPFPEWLDHGEDAWTFDQWQRLDFRAGSATLPTVSWRMRPDLRTFWQQHFRYMRGDGSAGMRSLVHGLRVGFYLALLFLLVFGLAASSFGALYLLAATWVLYLLLNMIRLLLVLQREGRRQWWWQCVLLLPVMLIGLDTAKIAGFLTGLLAPSQKSEMAARASLG